jgi:hypothetical protein
MSKLQERPSSLKRKHPEPEEMKLIKFFYFCWSYMPSWIRIRIANPDPDPGTPLNQLWLSQEGLFKFRIRKDYSGSGPASHTVLDLTGSISAIP